MTLFAELRANAWKIATVLVTVTAAGALMFAYVENRHLTKVTANQDKLINDPDTGYVAKLERAENERAGLVVAHQRQTEAFKQRAAEDAKVLEETRRRLADAQAESRAARSRVTEFLRRPPQGSTICEQYEDIDRRGMEGLK